MHRSRSVITGLLVIMLSLKMSGCMAASASGDGSGPQVTFVSTATFHAAPGATITFKTQNGKTMNDVPPQTLDLPHLVLYRNGALTDPAERTLIVEVTGIEVPSSGVTVTLAVETQHGDPDLGGGADKRIPVWHASRWIANTSGFTQTGVTAVFAHEFNETVISGTETIATPTDYFRYDIAVIDAHHPITNPLHTLGEDHAFLLENQWIARLPEVQEEPAGAAPDELIVYYCDMFPFQKSTRDVTTRLLRENVPDYVHAELIPAMVEAFRHQTDDWGFPWYDAWTSYRPGADPERLSVALADGRTWFHGRAPSRGHSGISINVRGGENARYDTLTDGIMSTFHHELFHSLQRNIDQNNGGNGDVDGEEDTWEFFSEGTAVLASSVGQPAVQFVQTPGPRAYVYGANSFVAGGGLLRGDLNTSYEGMIPHHAAIYWRFLYEQCGGMKDGVEDPAAGMQVIRNTLMALYSKDIVDIHSSTDLIAKVPEITDRALEGSSCPFNTHEESLVAFARAIYGLRLENGRCAATNLSECSGFHDPSNTYADPPLAAELGYDGSLLAHGGSIPSSFGMDFVELWLDPAIQDQPLTLEFEGEGATAQFDVQIWKLGPAGSKPRAVTPHPETVPQNRGGAHVYVIPHLDRTTADRLALIITRLDSDETTDPAGNYTITLSSTADANDDSIPA